VRGEQGTEKTETERVYSYYLCKGKYADDTNGERRHICTGHIFTPKTKVTECPVCGEPLIMLQTKTPKVGAITLAMEKCFKCQNRDKSTAVNNLQCLGGENYKNGERKKIRGTEACTGCPCAECCKEIIDEFAIGMRYGLNKTMGAMKRINDFAKWTILQHRSVDAEYERRLEELRSGDQMLKGIPYNMFTRWVWEATEKAEKEAKMFPGRHTNVTVAGNLDKPVGTGYKSVSSLIGGQ